MYFSFLKNISYFDVLLQALCLFRVFVYLVFVLLYSQLDSRVCIGLHRACDLIKTKSLYNPHLLQKSKYKFYNTEMRNIIHKELYIQCKYYKIRMKTRNKSGTQFLLKAPHERYVIFIVCLSVIIIRIKSDTS